MKTKKLMLALSVLFVLLSCSFGLLAQDQGDKVFEKALFLEESEGDLLQAIKMYEQIVKDYNEEPGIAAKAQFHIGLCYEKLGKTEAIVAYKTVINKYPHEGKVVAEARSRLTKLSETLPKGLSVINLKGWDKPGMIFEPFELSSDGSMGVGVEFIKGQNIIVYNLKTKNVKYITDHTWDQLYRYCYTYHPVLSPDDKEIAYFSSCIDKEVTENSLIVATLNGQSRVLASDEKDWYIPNAWLPDGSAILTIKGSPDIAPQLGLFSSKGENFKALVTLQKKDQKLGSTLPTACVSPDGQHILFTDALPGEKSNIYIMNTNGENPKPIMNHPAEDKFPRWSPDGKNIVFLSLRHGSWALWGIDYKNGEVTGEPFLIRDGMKDSWLLNWTANGLASWNWVRIFDIFQMDLNPTTGEPVGEPEQIKYTPTGVNYYSVWSPDGKSFAFLNGNYSGLGFNIVVVGDDTREFPVPKEHGPAGYLRWTPDGSTIGMVGANKENEWFIYHLNLNSGKWESTPLPIQGGTQFEWSSNGKSILFSKMGLGNNGAGIIELNPESGKERYVYSPNPDSTIILRCLHSSRDFKQLAFVENNDDVIVVNLETGRSHRVASVFGNVSWSPDGQKILVDRAYATEGSKQSLFILPVTGGSEKEINLSKSLPKKSAIIFSDWSPDGKKIVFTLRSQLSEVLLFQNVIPKEK